MHNGKNISQHKVRKSKKVNTLKATISETDQAIDAMVYKLYNLSEEEIAIVEE